jgi:hypothetical protein
VLSSGSTIHTRRLASEAAAALWKHAVRGGRAWSADHRPFVGVAHGASRLSLPLLAYGRLTGEAAASEAAATALRAERAWFVEPGYWHGPGFHPASTAPGRVLLVHGGSGYRSGSPPGVHVTGDWQSLAEVAAAIDLIRGALTTYRMANTSVCLEAAQRLTPYLVQMSHVATPANPSLLLGSVSSFCRAFSAGAAWVSTRALTPRRPAVGGRWWSRPRRWS